VTVNVGGDSGIQRVNVTGTGISDLIVTGTVVSGPGQRTSPAPGLIYEYVDLLPARYKTIEKVDLAFAVSRTWLNEQHVTPQDIRVFQLTNSTWSLLPITLVKTENLQSYYTAVSPGFTRFAIAAEPSGSNGGPDPSSESAVKTFGDMIKTSPVPTVSAVADTPAILQTTASPSLPATQPSPGFSSVTLIGAGIAGIIILIGVAVFFRKGKSDL
jgi:PGF-pre-PGF domain-containing protein